MTERSEHDQSKTQANRRRNLRSPLLALKVHLEDGDRRFFGYTKNISSTGMFVATLQTLPPQSEVPVAVHIPPPVDRTLQCRCEVVWSRSYDSSSPHEPGLGLRFVDLDESLAAAIEAWVSAVGG